MENQNTTRREREKLTVALDKAEFRSLRHFAIDQRMSASEVVRHAVNDFLKAKKTASNTQQVSTE